MNNENDILNMMTPEEQKRLTDAELKINNIEEEISELKANLKVLPDISRTLDEIKKLLIGSISDANIIGLVTQTKQNAVAIESLSNQIKELSTKVIFLTDTYKKHKWVAAGITFVLTCFILYSTKVWEIIKNFHDILSVKKP